MVEGVVTWRCSCRSLREPQAHRTWLTTADTVQVLPLSPCICATYSASACFPVHRNARHTYPTPLCLPNHAPTPIWGASQLHWCCPRTTTPNYYTTAGEWIAPTRDSLCWWHCPVISPTALLALPAILRRTISPCICVLVCECEPWNRDSITRRDNNARPTCRMMILIYT